MRKKTNIAAGKRIIKGILTAKALGCLAIITGSSALTAALAQDNATLIEISGNVNAREKKEPLAGVSVQLKGRSTGTFTNQEGYFTLKAKTSLPFTLVFSSVGFTAQEITVNSLAASLKIEMATQTVLGNEVVVTASRMPENILQSPVAIEKLDIRAIREAAAPGFYDALENVKGVQMITSSLTFKVPNTRGFNMPNNFRFMQLADGVDMQAATLGVPLGNAIGPTELDIASVEITPGAAAAIYGMNAINGMVNLLTRNPYAYQGLSLYAKTGVNHVDGIDHTPAPMGELALRYAKAFHNKLAFKINMGGMKGTDWRSNTRFDQNPNNLKSANPAYPELNGNNNIAFDAWNKYGDDALAGSNLVALDGLTINGKSNQTLRVSRTGYWENDLASPSISNLKADALLSWKPNENTELTYSYRIGQMDGTFQRGNKIRLHHVTVQNHHLELKGKHYTIQSYISLENTGDSYNLKPLADNLDLYSGGATDTKTDSSWGTKYRNALNSYAAANGGGLTSANLAAANQYAREQADASRVQPGTPAFEKLMNKIISINNWDIRSASQPDAPETGGAALVQKSRMYHTEGQWNLSHKIKIFDLLAGADARVYEVIPDGNNFVDFSRPIADRSTALKDGSFGKHLFYKKFGAFAQASKLLLEERLKIFGSLRYDYNPAFAPRMTPRLAVVYTLNGTQHFRFTYQQGYRFPSLFEALSYVNNGRIKRVGSLPYINQGLGYLDNSYTQASVVRFNAAVSAKGNTDEAALAARGLLQPAQLPAAAPEQISSFEIGYKAIIGNNRLVIDADAYSNSYSGFLGQVQVYVPRGETIGSDAAVLAMLDRNRDAVAASAGTAASKGQDRYRVYTNAKNRYHNFGAALGITWNLYKKYTLAGNASFNEIQSNNYDDIFVTAFNTPRWSANLSFSNRAIAKNIGFNVVWKWQDAFFWESPLASGNIAAFSTVDAQLTCRIPAARASIKLGGSNIFNHRHLQYAGGPTIGALYYIAFTVEGLLK